MSSEIILKSGRLFKDGKVEEAKALLIAYIKEYPTDTAAWFALSYCMDEISHKQKCLEQVLKFDPHHKKAHAAIEKLNGHSIHAKVKTDGAEEGITSLQHETVRETPGFERKKAGESAVQMGDKRRKKGLAIGIIGLVIVSVIALIISSPDSFGLGGRAVIGLLLIFFLIIRIVETYTDRKVKEAKRAYRGARAEEKIGKMLESLGRGYEVLHDVEYPYGNIDHVVISEKGVVFMIETKSHGGKVSIKDDGILVNGKTPEKDFIAQSLRNSYWLRDEIGSISGTVPWISAVLVFTNAFVPPMKPIKGVQVVNKKYLLKTIKSTSKKCKPNLEIENKIQEILTILSS